MKDVGGRPRHIDPISVKTSVRFRVSEVQKLRKWAKKRGMTASEYIRWCVMEDVKINELFPEDEKPPIIAQ